MSKPKNVTQKQHNTVNIELEKYKMGVGFSSRNVDHIIDDR